MGEGDAALPASGTLEHAAERHLAIAAPHAPRAPEWHVLWTRSHCERLVHDQLAPRGFDLFLPTIEAWSRRGGVRHLISVPMFPGYLFLHHALDRASYVEVLQARGLVALLGERWDRLAVVPDGEIEAIRRVLEARLPALPHPYLKEGQRVRIADGPLRDVEGFLVQSRPTKGLLVLSVELLRRSIAVEVDCTLVAAA
jgi:transcription antitermination factor NusG